MDKQQPQRCYDILPNGKCPHCERKVKDRGREGTIYRNNLLIIEDRTNRQIVRCKCKKKIYIS